MKKSFNDQNGSTLTIVIVLAVLAVIIGVGAYLLMFSPDTNNQVPANTQGANQEVVDTLNAVSKLMVLPKDEDPVVATVTDADKLKAEQPFYSSVTNGDRVVVFPKSQKAVIYSPSLNKIVNVGPILAQPNQNNQVNTENKVETNTTPNR